MSTFSFTCGETICIKTIITGNVGNDVCLRALICACGPPGLMLEGSLLSIASVPFRLDTHVGQTRHWRRTVYVYVLQSKCREGRNVGNRHQNQGPPHRENKSKNIWLSFLLPARLIQRHPSCVGVCVFLGLLLLSPVYASLTCTFVLTPLPKARLAQTNLISVRRVPAAGLRFFVDLRSFVCFDRPERKSRDRFGTRFAFFRLALRCVCVPSDVSEMNAGKLLLLYIMYKWVCVYLTLFCFYPSLTKKGIRFQMRLSAMVLVAETRGTIRNGSAYVVRLAFCAGSYFPMRLKSLFVSELGFMISWW